MESLVTQGLIIHVIRTTRRPFLDSHASRAVIAMTLVVIAIGIALSLLPIGSFLGFTALPAMYWPVLLATVACYLLLTQSVKGRLLRRHWM